MKPRRLPPRVKSEPVGDTAEKFGHKDAAAVPPLLLCLVHIVVITACLTQKSSLLRAADFVGNQTPNGFV